MLVMTKTLTLMTMMIMIIQANVKPAFNKIVYLKTNANDPA